MFFLSRIPLALQKLRGTATIYDINNVRGYLKLGHFFGLPGPVPVSLYRERNGKAVGNQSILKHKRMGLY